MTDRNALATSMSRRDGRGGPLDAHFAPTKRPNADRNTSNSPRESLEGDGCYEGGSPQGLDIGEFWRGCYERGWA